MAKRWLVLASALALFALACGSAAAPNTFSNIGNNVDAARTVAVPAPAQGVPAVRGAAEAQSGPGAQVNPGQPVLGVRFQSDRVLVLTAQLSLKADDAWSISDRVQSLAFALGGDITGVTQSGGGENKAATVTIRVPNERFNDALRQIKSLDGAELLSAQVAGEDRTEQFIDLDARLKAKQQEESRYLALLAKADKIDDILRIDQVLSQVRAQIEQLQGQLNVLKNRSSMATINVSVAPAGFAPKPLETGWQPAKTFQQATAALLATLRVFADYAIWALVWVWVPLLVLGVVFAVSRSRVRPNSAA